VPVWHDETLELQKQGKLRMVGIIQEQHPERARLFMQWKRMDWPVMVDSLDLLEVTYVPITLLIDEHGIVRRIASPRADPTALLSDFLDREFEALAKERTGTVAPPNLATLDAPSEPATAADWREHAEALYLWGRTERIDYAIGSYAASLRLEPEDGWTHFRAGVAYRRRADLPAARAGDFARAVDEWGTALEIDPNNYIWRRRIQQYGPRLDKPYPFYDWVAEARRDIEARGEEPEELAVEPRGAELARPARSFAASEAAERDREKDDRIHRDDGRLVEIETVVVPRSVEPGATVRVHLELRPKPESKAHWNNEVSGLVFRIEPPEGWKVDRDRIELDNPAAELGAVSEEVRRLEFEVMSPATATGAVELPAYALYYVCEGIDGACLYRRQDIEVRVSVPTR